MCQPLLQNPWNTQSNNDLKLTSISNAKLVKDVSQLDLIGNRYGTANGGTALGHVMGVAKIKARYPISYADAFVVAKAVQSGAIVVTGDPEYKVVSRLIKTLWVK